MKPVVGHAIDSTIDIDSKALARQLVWRICTTKIVRLVDIKFFLCIAKLNMFTFRCLYKVHIHVIFCSPLFLCLSALNSLKFPVPSLSKLVQNQVSCYEIDRGGRLWTLAAERGYMSRFQMSHVARCLSDVLTMCMKSIPTVSL